MKKISVVIPCYNEEDNVRPICEAVCAVMETELSRYDYEVVFIDNKSIDHTRDILTALCAENSRVKAIFNAKNFGQFNSPYHALCEVDGDCAVLLCCDFQDPVEMIPTFVSEWEKGSRIVCGIKTSSRENPLMRFLRTCYYKMIKKMSSVEQIEHFTGFGLYDASFLKVLRELNDPTPFLRGIVAELGADRTDIPYEQQRRRAGKTSNNFYRLYDAAMLSFTSYTKVGLRIATFTGFIMSALSGIAALIYLVLKLIYWDRFAAGTTPILLAVLVLGSVQLFFIGLLGEYIMNMNTRIMHRPLVIEEKRINFDKKETEND